jgi:periplasmic divalent cation tolerance protein
MFVAASSTEEAKTIASTLVREKLVACVNIIPGVQSIYEWEGNIEESNEMILMIKVIT